MDRLQAIGGKAVVLTAPRERRAASAKQHRDRSDRSMSSRTALPLGESGPGRSPSLELVLTEMTRDYPRLPEIRRWTSLELVLTESQVQTLTAQEGRLRRESGCQAKRLPRRPLLLGGESAS